MKDNATTLRRKHVRVVPISQWCWQVQLTVGVQSFVIDTADPHLTKKHADWYARMLGKALENLVRAEGKRS